jgi:hypothetical protein
MPEGFGDLMAGSTSCYVVDNLIGIPSFHYEPLFAREVARAAAAFRPTVIALELPDSVRSELEWSLECWPGPVVSLSHQAFFPFVPGDSILEGYRIGRASGIEIALVDVHLPEALRTPISKSHADSVSPWLGPELVTEGKELFLHGVQGLLDAGGETSSGNQFREAHMAARLASLMESHERVMWVGGMAHWRNIVERIRSRTFDAPTVPLLADSKSRRMRLSPSALYRMTQRLPYLVSAYAADPFKYDEVLATQSMALRALELDESRSTFVVSAPGAASDHDDPFLDPERGSPIDVARALLYARNLALTDDLRERPTFGELLTAAAGTIDPFYAGRLYAVAMEEKSSPQALGLDPLEHKVRDGHEFYVCGDEIIDAFPWLPSRLNERALTVFEIRKRSSEMLKDLPKGGGDKAFWQCYPPDLEEYESFVNYAMRRASMSDPGEVASVRFTTGMRDGLDVRATLRHWAEDEIYVREEKRGRLNFTNAALDWTSATEYSAILRGTTEGGWIDPSETHLGTCSRQTRGATILQHDPHMQRNDREFSLLTLDLPNSANGPEGKEAKSFYSKVIRPLVALPKSRDTLYDWLEIMFTFCAGKPFAYYSRYVPSPAIHRIAWQHDVEVVHFPLQRLPERLRRRNQVFRFMSLTRAQWDELQRRRANVAGTWSAPAA